MSYLDKTGLQHLWGKIRGIIGTGSLNTTNKTIIPAINELNNGLSTVESNLSFMISGNARIYGFSNKLYVDLLNLSSATFYGIAKVITPHGEKTINLIGYDATQTDTSGAIKTYKHNRSGVLDVQFVFPNAYTHGVLILGGAVVNAVIHPGSN